MQLVAYGAQDVFLTGTPEITFWKVSYRRHTNFAMESIEQTFSGQADFGRRVTCTISRNGDLAYRTYLQVTLPEINVDDFRRSGYLPEVICNFLALNGWSPGHDIEKFDNGFLKERFGLDRVIKTPAKFDRLKLLAFNTDAITAMAPDDFARRCHAHAVQYRTDYLAKLGDANFALLMKACQERSKTLDDPFRSNGFLLVEDDALAFSDYKSARKALGIGAAPAGYDGGARRRPAQGSRKAGRRASTGDSEAPQEEANARRQKGAGGGGAQAAGSRPATGRNRGAAPAHECWRSCEVGRCVF